MSRLIVFVLLLVASAIPANAQAPQTSDQLIATYHEIIRDIRADQEKYCAAPRSNNSGRCHADFLAVYPKIAEAIAWQMLYTHARNVNDTPSFQVLWEEYLRSRKAMLEAQGEVERLYYPQKASAVQQKATPVSRQR